MTPFNSIALMPSIITVSHIVCVALLSLFGEKKTLIFVSKFMFSFSLFFLVYLCVCTTSMRFLFHSIHTIVQIGGVAHTNTSIRANFILLAKFTDHHSATTTMTRLIANVCLLFPVGIVYICCSTSIRWMFDDKQKLCQQCTASEVNCTIWTNLIWLTDHFRCETRTCWWFNWWHRWPEHLYIVEVNSHLHTFDFHRPRIANWMLSRVCFRLLSIVNGPNPFRWSKCYSLSPSYRVVANKSAFKRWLFLMPLVHAFDL